jgi:hypothetical protein
MPSGGGHIIRTGPDPSDDSKFNQILAKKMKRLRLADVTPQRLMKALHKRVWYFIQTVCWKFDSKGRENSKEIQKFRDKHKGETCVIICNGPSIRATDMARISNYPTFCMNRSYLAFEEWGFTPTYFVATARHVLEQFSEDIGKLLMPKFISYDQIHLYREFDNVFFIRLPPRLNDYFSTDIHKSVSSGGTVTYATLQLAFFMGFKKVIIVGMDHRFSAQGKATKTEIRRDEFDKDHFHPNYFPMGVKWELPDLVRSELAYQLAREHYEDNNREIIDCTSNGACTIFKKDDLRNVLH